MKIVKHFKKITAVKTLKNSETLEKIIETTEKSIGKLEKQ